MNNPNVTASEPTEPLDVTLTPAAEIIEEAAPRSYIAAGIVAALLIVLLCVVGVALLGSGVLTTRPAPTPVSNTETRLKVLGSMASDGTFGLGGVNFSAGEKIELFVAFAPGAAFNQFVKIGDAQAGPDGSFALNGLRLPASPDNKGTMYLLARGSNSGFSPIVPVIINGIAPPTAPIGGATVTLAPATLPASPLPPTFTPLPTPLPDQPTYTPSPVTPTNPPTQSPTPDPNAVGVWYGRYYDNPDLSEPPVFVRYDANLSFNWRSGSPGGGIPNDNFSVLWTRNENFKTTDNYMFTLSVDDGARVYVDNVLVINEWRNGGLRTVKGNIGIVKGVHQIKVEYYEATGNAQVALTWGVNYAGWVGRYYNTADLSGPIIVKRDDVTAGDPFINFDWGFGSPDAAVNPDNFSVDWTRTVNFSLAGTYIFTATVDDGVRLYIDGNATPVFDNFATSGSRTITGSIALGAGPHAMEVQYVERSGQAKFQLSWAPVVLPPTSTPMASATLPPSATATATTPPAPTPSPSLSSTPVPLPTPMPLVSHTGTMTATIPISPTVGGG